MVNLIIIFGDMHMLWSCEICYLVCSMLDDECLCLVLMTGGGIQTFLSLPINFVILYVVCLVMSVYVLFWWLEVEYKLFFLSPSTWDNWKNMLCLCYVNTWQYLYMFLYFDLQNRLNYKGIFEINLPCKKSLPKICKIYRPLRF